MVRYIIERRRNADCDVSFDADGNPTSPLWRWAVLDTEAIGDQEVESYETEDDATEAAADYNSDAI